MMQIKNVIFVLGLPGSGKDVVSRFILECFKQKSLVCIRCCMGESLRKLKAVKQSGDLSDLSIVYKVLYEFLNEVADYYVLDGFPRSGDQLNLLRQYEKNHGIKVSMTAIFLECTESIALSRLSARFTCSSCNRSMDIQICESCKVKGQQRSDDVDIKVINKRISIYLENKNYILTTLNKINAKIYAVDSTQILSNVKNAIEKIVQMLTKNTNKQM